MGVLKRAKGNGSVGMTIKVPKDLHDRITTIKERCKSLGFSIDLAEGAVKGLAKLVGAAEKEIDDLEARKKSRTDNPTRPKSAASSSRSSSEAAKDRTATSSAMA